MWLHENPQDMPLDPFITALLDHTIDEQIKHISPFVKNCRNDTAKEVFHLRNPDDFALGMTLGSILESFRVAHRASYGKDFEADEVLEVIGVVVSRSAQIRDAITGITN
jgi:hypothetical protein